MITSLEKYPREEPEICTYETTSDARWQTLSNIDRRSNMSPFAGPYYDGEGWMLNAVLEDLRGCHFELVETKNDSGRPCILVMRSDKEIQELTDDK
tara:strand:+ start:488 stop:775 length:288 start_codon:yes stop_codon:yes gene_type:complete